jgi:hypothetical protein
VKREHLIARYEHNYFNGWRVATKRAGKLFVRYFSDRPIGRTAALVTARAFRDKLLSTLPHPSKIKRKYVCNTTGVIGVARVKERTRAGRKMVRYVASWPKHNGERGKATFSVALYGEAQAFRLARAARKAGVHQITQRRNS